MGMKQTLKKNINGSETLIRKIKIRHLSSISSCFRSCFACLKQDQNISKCRCEWDSAKYLKYSPVSSTPTYVYKNLEFIVDTSPLFHWKDVRSDMIFGLVRSCTKTILLAGDGDDLYQIKGTITTGVSDIPATAMIVSIFIKLLWQFT